jgi:hypothetical protein
MGARVSAGMTARSVSVWNEPIRICTPRKAMKIAMPTETTQSIHQMPARAPAKDAMTPRVT